jgi:hypothetical protein
VKQQQQQARIMAKLQLGGPENRQTAGAAGSTAAVLLRILQQQLWRGCLSDLARPAAPQQQQRVCDSGTRQQQLKLWQALLPQQLLIRWRFLY